jgi:hypothetical protein
MNNINYKYLHTSTLHLKGTPWFESTTPPRQRHAYVFRAQEKEMQRSSKWIFGHISKNT